VYTLFDADGGQNTSTAASLGSNAIVLLYWRRASKVETTRSAPPRRDSEKILIIKTGSTLPSLRSRKGDFEDWIIAGMGVGNEKVTVLDVTAGTALPENGTYGGVVITGSHSMVTDGLRWSERTASWLALEVATGTPTLGICYGHQLLSHALGGLVQKNPLGWELGTVDVTLQEPALKDEILGGWGTEIRVHVSHTQSVLRLPKGAVRLATNARDINQAFRVGRCAWGVQFHPEFDVEIVRAYIDHCRAKLTAEGQDPDRLIREASDVTIGSKILARFAAAAAKEMGARS
jgi:GMP synthase (glutamine-hydrolysing)